MDTVYTKDIKLSDKKTMIIKILSHDIKNVIPVVENLRKLYRMTLKLI